MMLHLSLRLLVLWTWVLTVVQPAFSLPPSEDVPEEVLRTAIIAEEESGQLALARSSLNGKSLSSAEYAAQLEQEGQFPDPASRISPDVKAVLTLLRLRQFLKALWPF
jgi:hypothetical protein